MQGSQISMDNAGMDASGQYSGIGQKFEDRLNNTGFSHGAYSMNQQRPGGYSNRHPRRGNMSINTATFAQSARQNQGDLTAPGTAVDMNFTPLLPSGLLLGSPFQPGTPSYNNFGGFQGQPPQTHQQQQQQQSALASPIGNQQPSYPSQYQSVVSPINSYGMQQFMPGPQSPTFANVGTQGYDGASQMQVAATVGNASSRTVYLGNIPPETSAEEILGHVRSGAIESVRLLPDKNCAFISFLDGSSATHFHSDAILKKLAIRGHDIKVGWGKPSQVPQSVAMAVQQSGASRNVYLGNLSDNVTEQELRDDLGKFGPIDTVKIVREKAIGFVHFLSIGNAMKAVAQLPQDPKWQAPRRVYYGKDRCAYISKTQQQNAAQYLGIAPGYAHMLNGADRDLISNALAQQSVAAAAVATQAGGVSNLGNRTVYLGNIHPETTIEEICNVVRGGLLHHIRYIPDKHICFVTFIDPTSAASFYALSEMQGLMIHNRRLKIGWGKHSGAIPPAIALAVSGGASRNVYIGNLDESFTEERLRQDFSEYGEIELVNSLREKSCAFVNFTNIANAIKAIEAIRSKEEYSRFKVNFGKDRCGNAPRQNNQNNQHAQHAQHQQQQQFQVVQTHDGLNSPNGVNGHLLRSISHKSSVSPTRVGLSPPPGSTGSNSQNGLGMVQQNAQGATASSFLNAGNSNPLTMYLNQLSLQEQDLSQQQPQQQNSYGNLSSQYYGNGASNDAFLNGGLEPSQPQSLRSQQSHGAGHMSSLSQGINNLSLAASTGASTVGGLLAPSRNQHARAISLPAFSQEPLTNGTSHSSQQSQLPQQSQQQQQLQSTQSLFPMQSLGHRQNQSSFGGFAPYGGTTWGLNGLTEEDTTGAGVR